MRKVNMRPTNMRRMNMRHETKALGPTIRTATINDVREIVLLEQAVPNAAHWSAQQYENRLEGGCLLVAECAGRIAAFVCASVLSGEWEIENIVVEGASQRRGIASALLNSLSAVCEKERNAVIHLEVRESNVAARQLYKKHGFRQVGRRPKYYRDPAEDAILYTKLISD